jgi:hypothetical protein
VRLRGPSTPALDPYEGPAGPDGIQAYRERIGQDNPATREYQRMQHGRYLTGFGDDSPAFNPDGGDPGYESGDMAAMEEADDVFGSGIFDPPGRPTSNNTMGIFASDYGLPGYVAREVPYAVSRDVTDADGGGVVYIPAGGYYHIEDDGRVVPHPILGPTPRPPANVPAPFTDVATPYVTMQPESAARPPLNAGYPVIPMPTYKPGRAAYPPVHTVPDYPSSYHIRDATPSDALPYGPVDERFDAGVPIATGAYAGRRSLARRGVGEDAPTASTFGLVVGCAVIGGVIGLVAATMTAKGAR